MVTTVLDGCTVATVDAAGTQYPSGHVVLRDGVIAEVGAGPAPELDGPIRRVDATGCLATPGLINTHHHLYQWATRGYAVDDSLFGWLRTLYPVWAGIDADTVGAAARAGLARLALTGCTTSTDHH
jgi:cytosine/adenosine deaminase-related metal-dependent hydrolase